jgi:hypothetical protein
MNMKKIIGFSICMLLITIVLPTSSAEVESFKTFEDDVEIDITAGWRGKDFGRGVTVNMLNHRTENVTVFFDLTLNYLIRNDLDTNTKYNYTLLPDLPTSYNHGLVPCYPDGIKFISITAKHEDKIVTREGLSILNWVILFN